jgi:hypothetical protein
VGATLSVSLRELARPGRGASEVADEMAESETGAPTMGSVVGLAAPGSACRDEEVETAAAPDEDVAESPGGVGSAEREEAARALLEAAPGSGARDEPAPATLDETPGSAARDEEGPAATDEEAPTATEAAADWVAAGGFWTALVVRRLGGTDTTETPTPP